jgi:putative membrane protein
MCYQNLLRFKLIPMRSILSYWDFNIANVVFLLLLISFYLYITNFKFKRKSLFFIAATFILILCIASPLHYLGEHYLFSAHMVSHVLILLVAAPLFIASIPKENRVKRSYEFISKKISGAPLVSWFVGVSVMWAWHVPFIFNQMFSMPGMQVASMNSMSGLMFIHMASLFIAGSIFCLPIINPCKEFRIAPLAAVLYLSSACVFCSLLGLFITFAPAATFTGYIPNYGTNNFLSIIRNDWKINAAEDQQIGGLIMWVPCCFIYLSASMVILIEWFEKKETIVQTGTTKLAGTRV